MELFKSDVMLSNDEQKFALLKLWLITMKSEKNKIIPKNVRSSFMNNPLKHKNPTSSLF